jgi:hypothetical protein
MRRLTLSWHARDGGAATRFRAFHDRTAARQASGHRLRPQAGEASQARPGSRREPGDTYRPLAAPETEGCLATIPGTDGAG